MTRTTSLLAAVAVLCFVVAAGAQQPAQPTHERIAPPPAPYKSKRAVVPPKPLTPFDRTPRLTPNGPFPYGDEPGAPIRPTPTKTPDFEGRHATVDVPAALHMRNTVGTDNQGLCVWTSLEVLFSRWCHDPRLVGLQQHMTHERGGGWPARVASKFAELAPGIDYVQVEGSRDQIARALDLAFKTRRGACGTYGYDPQVYGGATIAHMIDYAEFDRAAGIASVIDNNRPSVWEWMSTDELLERCVHPHQSGWVVIPGGNPPPPEPK